MRKLVFAALMLVSSGAIGLAKQMDAPAGGGQDKANQDKASTKADFDKMCNAKAPSADSDNQYIETLTKTLLLGDDQKKKLQDYRDTQAKAIDDAKSKICNDKPDLSSLEAGLNFRQKMLEEQLDMLKSVNPKLIDFYNSLNGQQKARFDDMRQNMASRGSRGHEARRRP